MRTLLLGMLAIAAAGCGSSSADPNPSIAVKPAEVIKPVAKTDPTVSAEPAEVLPIEAKETTEATSEATTEFSSFKLTPVPKSVLSLKGYNSGMRAFVSTKRKVTAGLFTGMRAAPLRFKIIEPDAEGKSVKVAIDWNKNKDFTDDGTLDMPAMNTVTSGTVKLEEQEVEVSLYRYKYSSGYSLMLRPGKWLEGSLEIDGKPVRAALYDLNFNGIDTKGGDLIVIDQNGDGKLGPRGRELEGQAQLSNTMMLPGGIFDFAYDATTKTATLKPSENVGTVAIKYPEWKNVSVTGQARMGGSSQRFTAKDGTLVLPVGDYRPLYLNLNAETKTGKLLLKTRAGNVSVKKGETTTLTIEEPSGVKPKIRIVKGSLKVRESFSFATNPVGIAPNYSVYAQGKRVPPPKIEVYKGDEKLTQGSMKYG